MEISGLFKGRLNRRNFALGLLTSFGAIVVAFALMFTLTGGEATSNPAIVALWIVVLVVIIGFNITLQVRRWHDIGKSGWYVLLNLLPYVNGLIFLYVIFKGGDKTNNKFGDVPKSTIRYPDDILGR